MANPISVLVVDDDPSMLKMVAAILRGAGYSVRIASTAEQALTTLQTQQPVVILVDLRLPGLHGIEFTRHVRADPHMAKSVILMMTASSGPDAVRAAMEAGCDGFLRKPFGPEALLGFVEEHLNNKVPVPQPAPPPSAPVIRSAFSSFVASSIDLCRALLLELKFRFPDSAAGGSLRRMTNEAREYGLQPVTNLAEKAAAQIDALWRDPEALRETLVALCSAFEALSARPEPEKSAGPAPEANQPGIGPRILVVDDDASITRLVQRLVESLGVVCDAADQPAEAMRKIYDLQPDLVIIDLNLAGSNGLDLLKTAKSRFPEMRTVLLTGSQAEDDVVRGFELGADDYIAKPFKPSEFTARLKRLLPKRTLA